MIRILLLVMYILRRSLPVLLAEAFSKVSGIRKAHLKGYLRNVSGLVAKEHPGTIQANGTNKLGGRLVDQCPKLTVHLCPAQMHFIAKAFNIKCFIPQMIFYHRSCPEQEALIHGDRVLPFFWLSNFFKSHSQFTQELLLQFFTLQDQVLYPNLELFRIERFGDKIIRSGLQSFNLAFHPRPCRQDDHRDMAGPLIAFQFSRQLIPIHLRHHHIGQNQVGYMFNRLLQPLPSVSRLQHPVILPEYTPYIQAQVGVVFDNEN